MPIQVLIYLVSCIALHIPRPTRLTFTSKAASTSATGNVGPALSGFLKGRTEKESLETSCKFSPNTVTYCSGPSGGMADAGDLKSPAHYGRVGSNPTSAITEDRKQRTEDREKTVIKSVKDLKVYYEG